MNQHPAIQYQKVHTYLQKYYRTSNHDRHHTQHNYLPAMYTIQNLPDSQMLYTIGQIVFATCPDHPPSPAKVTSISTGCPNGLSICEFIYTVSYFGQKFTSQHRNCELQKFNQENVEANGKIHMKMGDRIYDVFKKRVEMANQELRLDIKKYILQNGEQTVSNCKMAKNEEQVQNQPERKYCRVRRQKVVDNLASECDISKQKKIKKSKESSKNKSTHHPISQPNNHLPLHASIQTLLEQKLQQIDRLRAQLRQQFQLLKQRVTHDLPGKIQFLQSLLRSKLQHLLNYAHMDAYYQTEKTLLHKRFKVLKQYLFLDLTQKINSLDSMQPDMKSHIKSGRIEEQIISKFRCLFNYEQWSVLTQLRKMELENNLKHLIRNQSRREESII